MPEDPQPSETLTLSPRHQQNPQLSPRGADEPQPMASLVPVPDPDPDLALGRNPNPNPTPTPTPASARKHVKRRKPPLGKKRRAEIQEKLSLLRKNLRLVPFNPCRSPDLSRHGRLFRSLGLLDFACLDLDRDLSSLRADLVADLIANYDRDARRSEARDHRISVSRADLGRALSLPVKRDKSSPQPSDSDLELFKEEDSVSAITDFVSNWMVFLEDACVLPEEVVSANRLVREGQPHRVDWAALMWTMVERELIEVPRSGTCYYASHLQRLMKNQKPELLLLESEPEPEHMTTTAEDDTGIGGCPEIDDTQGPGLTLGLGAQIDAEMDTVQGKAGEEESWRPLQQCGSRDLAGVECDGATKGGEGFDEDLAAKFSSLEGLTSTDLLHAMGNGDISYGMIPVHSLEHVSSDFLTMGMEEEETTKGMNLDPGPADPFMFGDDCKREVDETYDGGNDDDNPQGLAEDHRQKRMRSEGVRWGDPPMAFDSCMEQVQFWSSKAKIAFEERGQAYAKTQMQLECMLQQKDQIMRSLENTRMEDLKKMHRYEHELNLMAQVVCGYKKALKETRNAFEEYRKQFPQGDEPVYIDVGVTGGVVLTIRESEKKRLEEENAMRDSARQLINDFQKQWFTKLNERIELLTKMVIKLGQLEEEVKALTKEVKLLKERVAV